MVYIPVKTATDYDTNPPLEITQKRPLIMSKLMDSLPAKTDPKETLELDFLIATFPREADSRFLANQLALPTIAGWWRLPQFHTVEKFAEVFLQFSRLNKKANYWKSWTGGDIPNWHFFQNHFLSLPD